MMSEPQLLLRKALVEAAAGGPHTIDTVVSQLEADYPNEIADFMVEHQHRMFRQWCYEVLKSARLAARQHKPTFESARDDYLSIFDTSHSVGPESEDRLPLRMMKQPHLLYVADDYNKRADDNRFYAEKYRYLAKQVGTKTIEEVFTIEEMEEVFNAAGGEFSHGSI